MSIQSSVLSMLSTSAYLSGQWRQARAQEEIAKNTAKREENRQAEAQAQLAVKQQQTNIAQGKLELEQKKEQRIAEDQIRLKAKQKQLDKAMARLDEIQASKDSYKKFRREVLGEDYDAAVSLYKEEVKKNGR